MRADRLLSILILLQSRGMLSARQLATELEVSERTIYRDMDALSLAGFPVYANAGKGGGFALLEGYSPELSGFTTRDIQALSALHIPHSLDEIGLGDALRHALLKLLASTGHTGSGSQWMRQRFLMDSPVPKQPSQSKSMIPLLQRAAWDDRWIRCRLQFLTHAGISNPVRIAPYTLITSEQRWYIIGARRDFLRVYPIEMLVNISLTEENFTRPADYIPGPIWDKWCTTQQSLLNGYKVKAWIRKDVLDWLERTRRWPLKPLPAEKNLPGWSFVEITFNYFSDARTHLLGFGNGVKIIAPESLRLSTIDYANEFLRENQE